MLWRARYSVKIHNIHGTCIKDPEVLMMLKLDQD